MSNIIESWREMPFRERVNELSNLGFETLLLLLLLLLL